MRICITRQTRHYNHYLCIPHRAYEHWRVRVQRVQRFVGWGWLAKFFRYMMIGDFLSQFCVCLC